MATWITCLAGYSFTKQESTTLYVSKEVLHPQNNILFIDDFFAKGSTLKAVEEIISQAGANLLWSRCDHQQFNSR